MVTPNAVTPDHFEELRNYYTDHQITELLAVCALSGFLNRYNDSLAVVTDQESVDWATEHPESSRLAGRQARGRAGGATARSAAGAGAAKAPGSASSSKRLTSAGKRLALAAA